MSSENIGTAENLFGKGLLLVALHKAGFRLSLLPQHVINAAHSSWTERTSVFIRGI